MQYVKIATGIRQKSQSEYLNIMRFSCWLFPLFILYMCCIFFVSCSPCLYSTCAVFFCQLFPLLVQSLLCDNVQLQQSTMDALCTMITDAPDFLVKHVDSVIPQLLKLTTYKPAMVSLRG